MTPLILLLAAMTQVATDDLPKENAALPDDVNTCVLCHRSAEFWSADKKRFYITPDTLAHDVHFQRGVRCFECHGGNPKSFDAEKAHVRPDGQPADVPFSAMTKSCGACHEKQLAALSQSVHGKKNTGTDRDAAKPLECRSCHGRRTHGIRPVNDPDSVVRLTNQVRVCGKCHEDEAAEYTKSPHGHSLFQAGLSSAVCADCHGAHGVYSASNTRSTLHPENVATTCAKCHRFIKERLDKSVHGRGVGLGHITKTPAPGGEIKRKPSCTDCHQGHDLPDPKAGEFRLTLPGRCGNCHLEYAHSYSMSLHGALTDLGYEAGAKCSDCHGGHDILPIDDPNSRLAPGERRLATCRNCHPHAVKNFGSFLPHADYHNASKHPILHAVFLSMELLIYSVFAFFGVHTILWFIRSVKHVRQHGRPGRLAPGGRVYVRFETIHRLLHAVVAISFLGLALTGLPLRYSSEPWAQKLVFFLGGFQSTSIWHRICGVITILYFLTHVTWLAVQVWKRVRRGDSMLGLMFGPDSPVPNPRDLLDILRMFRWFVGMGPKPTFERWTYWEKFDYWAVFWGVGIIGTSGLLLWFPNIFCMILPGESLNLAKIIHSEEALLATSFIFAIHFFGTHLRPEKFPIDMSVLSGLVSEEEMLEERADFVERMQREGRLQDLEAVVRSRKQLYGVAFVGFIALTVGLLLLAGILSAMFGI